VVKIGVFTLVCNSHDQIKITEIGTSDDKDWKTELIKTIFGSKKNHKVKEPKRGRHGRDRMGVGLTTTCAISSYLHKCCEFEPR
jgi:hypothetical protein